MSAPTVHPIALSPGTPLVEALEARCAQLQIADARVLIRGGLTAVTLQPTVDDPPVTLSGRLHCVYAEGWLKGGELEIHGLVSWAGPGMPGSLGGIFEAAVCDHIEVMVSPWSLADSTSATPAKPTKARRGSAAPKEVAPKKASRKTPESPVVDLSEEMDALQTPAAPPRRAPKSTPAPEPAASTGWGAAVAQSKKTSTPRRSTPRGSKPTAVDPKGVNGDELQVGDLLQHPRFGRCRVMRPAERGKVKVRLPAGRLTDLHLKVVRLIRQPDENGARVFKVLIARRD
ncbi:MAG: hypothetical protein ACE366_01300 [Bradymonadia bacterium]